jgi:hypothetical protein
MERRCREVAEMLFLTKPQTARDIREFCSRFNEGIRVEYKSVFDESVRKKLPAIVSSFANTLGGILVVGVNTLKGVPQQPIEGFPETGEELPLTVESICLQGINPAILPRTTIVPSNIEGKMFAVVEVEESSEAPHAIENSRKVYVRTEGASIPYDLATVEQIIELLKRREAPLRRHDSLLNRAREQSMRVVSPDAIHSEMWVSPIHPHHAVSSSEDTWQFLSDNAFRPDRPFFPHEALRRVEDGTAAFRDGEYGLVNRFGLVFARKRVISLHKIDWWLELVYPLLKVLVCAEKFYDAFGYRGDVLVDVSVNRIRDEVMPFVPNYADEMFQCFEHTARGHHVIASENLRLERENTIQEVLAQLFWSFWQAEDPFPRSDVNHSVHEVLRTRGLL